MSSTPLANLNQDLRLLDILEALPRPEEPDTQALRDRLSALCASQSLEASPARIEQAVNHFLAGHIPEPMSSEALDWVRPSSLAEREAWAACLSQASEKLRKIEMYWLFGTSMLGLLPLFLGMVIAFNILNNDWATVCPAWAGFSLVCAPFWVSGLSYLVYGRFKRWRLERHPWFKAARDLSLRWRKTSYLQDAAGLAEYPEDIQKMKHWLASSKATAALRQIAKSDVPLSWDDARHLNRLADADAKIQQQLADANAQEEATRLWKQSLVQLASS